MILPVSILVLTKDERQDLPGCLASVAWSDDIHVYDSCSTDGTQEIARRFGARVTERPFDNWASHQNWGLRNIAFKHKWVFYIDADERVSENLIAAIAKAVQDPGAFRAFRVRRRDFFEGRWLKHVQASAYYIRLFQPQFVSYERLVNPVTKVDAPVGELVGYLDHFPFSKGISHWLSRHNAYSTFEAQQILQNRCSGVPFSVVKAFTARDFNERRFHQKELFYRIPARPLFKFFLLYLGKRGFLDGRPGLKYSLLQAIYEYFIVLKTEESIHGADVPSTTSLDSR